VEINAAELKRWKVDQDVIEEEANTAWDKLLKQSRLASPVESLNAPVAYLLGGQPGAGKTTSKKTIIKKRFRGDALFISVDDFREQHPKFKEIYKKHQEHYSTYTHQFATGVNDIILKKAIENRYNIVIENTFKYIGSKNIRDGGVIGRIDELIENGYEYNIVVATCPAALSLFDKVDRVHKNKLGDNFARAVPTDIHNEVVAVLAQNVQEIFRYGQEEALQKFNLFSIVSRDGELWNNQDDKYKNISPKSVIDGELWRLLRRDEIDRVAANNAKYTTALKTLKSTLETLEKSLNKPSVNLFNFLEKSAKLKRELNLQSIIDNSKTGIFNKLDENRLKEEFEKEYKAQENIVKEMVETLNQEKDTTRNNLNNVIYNIRKIINALEPSRSKIKDRSKDQDLGL
jgi:UDP-N-acetylglucosamine kinase